MGAPSGWALDKEAPSNKGAFLVSATPPIGEAWEWVLLTVGVCSKNAAFPCRIPLVVNKSTHLLTSSAAGSTLSEVEE